MGTAEIAAYLTHLVVERKLAASTQNQAFSAILFLYQQVLEIELDRIEFLRTQRPERLPVVLAVEEVRALLDGMTGLHRLLAELLYGSGLRILECCRLHRRGFGSEVSGSIGVGWQYLIPSSWLNVDPREGTPYGRSWTC